MADKDESVTWSSLPRKDQLFLLCLIRFSEPVVRYSIISYIYYQLQSLDESLSSAEIVTQAAYLQTSFTIAQCLSSMFWGRVSDSPRGGRKLVMLVSLSASFMSCALFGFIGSFKHALLLRIFEGITNGNVAVTRTMVSEIVKDKKYQARAFVLLPICSQLATIISPLIAGASAEVGPNIQHNGGEVPLLKKYPYALPALLNAGFLLFVLLATFLFLEETSMHLRNRFDPGLALSRRILSRVPWLPGTNAQNVGYEAIAAEEHDEEEMATLKRKSSIDEDEVESKDKEPPKGSPPILPTSRMFTANLLLVLLSAVLQEIHLGIAGTSMPSFLSVPVSSKEEELQRVLPFRFGGGAGFRPHSVSIYAALFGVLGVPIQVLVYPRISQRLGTMKMWRLFMFGFPLIYFMYPYIAVMPSTTPPPGEKTGVPVWALITLDQVLTALVAACVVPATMVLTNSSSPHPSALGRTHSITFMVTMGVRAVSFAIAGNLLAYGTSHNLSGLVFWFCSLVAVGQILGSPYVKEGNGHEIRLPGDEED